MSDLDNEPFDSIDKELATVLDKNSLSHYHQQQSLPHSFKIQTTDTRNNYFDQISESIVERIKQIHLDCGEIIEYSLKNDLALLKEIITVIRSNEREENEQQSELINQCLLFMLLSYGR